jgi:hypothetical protein
LKTLFILIVVVLYKYTSFPRLYVFFVNPLLPVDVNGALDPDAKRINAIGRPAHGYVGMKDTYDDGAVHGVDG